MADLRVIALISTYNGQDIIGQVVRALIAQGVLVYLIDHCSSDDTVAEVAPYVGRGVIEIERFPAAPEEEPIFSWESILKRKQALSRELDADWVIHHDADEFRESPWPGLTLRDAIGLVDAAGYNAIDFQVLNFWPTEDNYQQTDDIRTTFQFYEPAAVWDRVQVKCWKHLPDPVDLVSSGGHDAEFDGRRVFPIRF